MAAGIYPLHLTEILASLVFYSIGGATHHTCALDTIYFTMKSFPLILLILISVACHNQNSGEYLALGDADMEFEDLLEVPPTKQSAPPQPGQVSEQERSKKIIKNGGIDFQSENVQIDYEKIRELLPKYDAYIEHENQSKTTQRITFDLTIRVPSAVYDTLYSDLSTLVYRLDNRYSNVEDVTMRYYDLKTQITNKKALETRYIELLKQASEIKDILEIERNLNQIRTDIEQLQGQFNYLSKQVNFSTINLSFYELLPYVYEGSQRKGFGARILSALNNGWQGFLSFLIGLTAAWPFILLIIGGIYLFRKLRKRWKKKSV